MVPGARKIELFARNNNLRRGWLSLGNQLGEYFDWDKDRIYCDVCGMKKALLNCSRLVTCVCVFFHQTFEGGVIAIGTRRYKSKVKPNRDLCERCMKSCGDSEEQYFSLENEVDEMVFHEWYSCK
jgi:mRNA (2'-O-methyladenosine-N6-)-methyltransferase